MITQTKTLALLTALVLLIASAAFMIVACESSGGGSADNTEDIEDRPEQCQSFYVKYSRCAESCDGGGFCVEECVETWYPHFLECCDTFNGDTECLSTCFDELLACYDAADPLDHETRYDCYLTFADCTDPCPPPLADPDTVPEPEGSED